MKPARLALPVVLLLGLAACGKPEAPAAAGDPAQAVAAPAKATVAEEGSAASPTTDAAVTGAPEIPTAPVDNTPGSPAAATPAAAGTETTAPAATAAPATGKQATQASAPRAVNAAPAPAGPVAPVKPAATTATTATAAGTDPGTVVHAETLRAKPAIDATAIGTLAGGTRLNILARCGGWYQVSSNGQSGWVRMLSVRRSAAASTDIAGLAAISSGRAGTGSVVSSTGVRGLDSEDLETAVFNEARVARAEALRSGRADAEKFARQGGLNTQDVPALPAAK